MNRKVFGLIVVLLVALAVRVYGAVAFPFEQDELYTVNEATHLFNTTLKPGIQARPLFFLMEHPLVTNLPQTEFILRLLPLVFGILGVWVTWLLARHLLNDRAALFATLLVALSPWHMYASAFTRYYSLIYLLAALVYWLLPRAYDTDSPKLYAGASLALFLGLWSHPSFVFPVAAASLAVMMVTPDGSLRWRWPSRNGWVYLWGPFIAGSGIVWAVIRAIHGSSAVDNGGDRGLLATFRLVPAMIDSMTPTIFVAGLMGACVLLNARSRDQRRFGLMTLFGVVGMLVALFGLAFMTSIYADYGIAALPLVFISVASLVDWVAGGVSSALETRGSTAGITAHSRERVVAANSGSSSHGRWVFYAVSAVIVVGMLPATVSYLSDGTRFDFRPALARITKDAPDRAVMVWPNIILRKYAPHLRDHELHANRPRLDSILTQERDVWAIVPVKRYGIVSDDEGDLARWLSDECRLVDSYQRPRVDYRMYRVDLWRCTVSS